jgi:hypothetical protein
MAYCTMQTNEAPLEATAAFRQTAFEPFVAITIGRHLLQPSAQWLVSAEGDKTLSDVCNDLAMMFEGLAAQLRSAGIDARPSDLFRCPKCEQHFISRKAVPTCCATYKVVNVPEDTIYCGTCNLAAEVDADGCCATCKDGPSRDQVDREISLEAQRA